MQNNKLYWKLSSFFFLFFLSIASIFTFFAIWLGQSLNLSGAQTGIVFSVNAVFTMLFQPLYGYISDKLGLRKNLLYFISILVILSECISHFHLSTSFKLEFLDRSPDRRILSCHHFFSWYLSYRVIYRKSWQKV